MTDFLIRFAGISASMAAVILLLCLFSKPLKKVSCASRYLLWAVIIIRLCIPVTAGFLPTLINVPTPEAGIEAESTLPAPKEEVTVVVETKVPVKDTYVTDPPSVTLAPPQTEEPVTSPNPVTDAVTKPLNPVHKETNAPITEAVAEMPEEASPKLSTEAVILAIWCAGIFVSLSVETVRYASFKRSVIKSFAEADEKTTELYRSACAEMNIRKAPKLCVSEKAESPMLIGILRPVTVVPKKICDDPSLKLLICHELVHYKRGDLYLKVAASIARAVHWFNPTAYVAERKLSEEMELSCDEKALLNADEVHRIEYGEAMLRVAKNMKEKYAPVTTNFNPEKKAVKERLMNIFDTDKKKKGIPLIALILVFAMISSSIIGCKKTETPPTDTTAGENDTTAGENEQENQPEDDTVYLRSHATKTVGDEKFIITYDYDEYNNLITQLITGQSYGESYVYGYENHKTLIYKAYSHSNGFESFTYYTYENGLLSTETTTIVDGELLEYTLYSYTGKQLTEKKRFFAEGDIISTSYTYDDDGKPVFERETRNNAFSSSTQYFYDGDKVVKKETTRDGGAKETTEYTYDEHGNLIKEKCGDTEITYEYKKVVKKSAESESVNVKLTWQQAYGKLLFEELANLNISHAYNSEALFDLEYISNSKIPDLLIINTDDDTVCSIRYKNGNAELISYIINVDYYIDFTYGDIRGSDDGKLYYKCEREGSTEWFIFEEVDQGDFGNYMLTYSLKEESGKYYFTNQSLSDEPEYLTKEEYYAKLDEFELYDENFKTVGFDDFVSLTPENIEKLTGFTPNNPGPAPEGAATTIEDIDKLTCGEYNEYALKERVTSFLLGNTSRIAECESLSDEAVAADYATIEFGDFYTWFEYDIYYRIPTAYLVVDIKDGGNTSLSEGYHTLKFSSELFPTIEDLNNYNRYQYRDKPLIDYFQRMLGITGYDYLAPASDIPSEKTEYYSYCIYDFIGYYYTCCETRDLTRADVEALAYKIFGCTDTTAIDRVFIEDENGYMIHAIGHGGLNCIHDIVEYDDSSITVQYYADANKFVKSHRVKYTFEGTDPIAIVSKEILEESPYGLFGWAT